MRDWKRIVGALCIVASMALGAVAGFVYVRLGAAPVEPDAGTRSEAAEPFNLDGSPAMTEETDGETSNGPIAFADPNALPAGLTMKTVRLTSEDTAGQGTNTATPGGASAGRCVVT